MNRKRIILIGLGITTVLITILAGTVANRIGQNRKRYIESLENSDAVITDEVELVDASDSDVTSDDADKSIGRDEAPDKSEEASEAIQAQQDEKPEENLVIGIFGSDERADEPSRSDIIMILNYLPSSNKLTLISIPRDTKVAIEGHGQDKINHAYTFGGNKLLERTIEDLFDTKLDYHCRINFVGFSKIIDELDGVEVDAKKDYKYQGDVIVPEGVNHLYGDDALFYVRFRSDAEGDFGRIKRQQEVIGSLGKKVVEWDDGELYPKLLFIYQSYLDTDMPFALMLQYIESAEVSLTYETYTLKTTSDVSTGIWYELYDEDHLEELRELITR